jgi:glycosyltransferase
MIEELNRQGIENEVFVPTYDNSIAVIKPNNNVYVSECFNKWDRLLFDYKQSKIIKAIEEYYDIASFDLIHAYTLFTDGNVARILSEKYGIPYVVAVRNTDVNDFFKYMIHLRSRGVKNMLSASKVFFLSESYRNTVFEDYISDKYRNYIATKVEILPNGIDDFWFENLYLEERHLDKNETIRFVYVGVIDKNKNIITTQAALSLLRKKGYKTHFSVVGKVKDQMVYETIRKDQFTEVLPATSKENLIRIYRNADIFIMPSFTESFGLVYAEAMSQGLPIIYSKGQGFDGQFPDGKVGYAVISNSPESVANGVEKIIKDYYVIAQNCEKLVSCFTWNNICKKYISDYHEIVGIK